MKPLLIFILMMIPLTVFGNFHVLTPKEVSDALNIIGLSRAGNNNIFIPQYNRSNTDKPVPIYLYTFTQDNSPCEDGKIACSIQVTRNLARGLNKQNSNDPKLYKGDCIIFIPKRDSTYPRSWLYTLGHEFSHCVFGKFHRVIDRVPEPEA